MKPIPCTCTAGRVMYGPNVWSPCAICDGTGDRTKNRNFRDGHSAGFAEALELDAPVIEWANEALTAMQARAGWSLAHDQLRKALDTRAAAIRALAADPASGEQAQK